MPELACCEERPSISAAKNTESVKLVLVALHPPAESRKRWGRRPKYVFVAFNKESRLMDVDGWWGWCSLKDAHTFFINNGQSPMTNDLVICTIKKTVYKRYQTVPTSRAGGTTAWLANTTWAVSSGEICLRTTGNDEQWTCHNGPNNQSLPILQSWLMWQNKRIQWRFVSQLPSFEFLIFDAGPMLEASRFGCVRLVIPGSSSLFCLSLWFLLLCW